MIEVNKNYSKQENFTLDLLHEKTNGYYVELGAFHSKECSNTYYLENDYGWNGVSFEVMEDRLKEFTTNRRNPCYGDALTFDYRKYFEENNKIKPYPKDRGKL